MIIVSQDRRRILNFDNVIVIYFKLENKEYSIYADTNTKQDVHIGSYKTVERAKEILEEIINMYKVTEGFVSSANRVSDNVGALVIRKGFVYYMPKE